MGGAPEFSRLVEIPRSIGREMRHRIVSDPGERDALAKRFSLLALDRFEADVTLNLLAGGMVRLEASFVAAVVQECVVTLEPVPSVVEERFSLLYGHEPGACEIVLDGAAETVEPLDGNRIDIGEAVAQQLSLALDPFPRAAGLAAP